MNVSTQMIDGIVHVSRSRNLFTRLINFMTINNIYKFDYDYINIFIIINIIILLLLFYYILYYIYIFIIINIKLL